MIKHKKEKAKLVGWSLISAIGITLLITLLSSSVDPSSFDSEPVQRDILGRHSDYTEESEEYLEVVRVADGDTIVVKIENESKSVRLLGIDAPESKHPRKSTECFGLEASERLEALLVDKQVRLEIDVTQGDVDRYGRLLRYVYLPDGTSTNELLLSEGYAFEYTYDSKPYLLQKDFIQAEQDARMNKRGLWADSACGGAPN